MIPFEIAEPRSLREGYLEQLNLFTEQLKKTCRGMQIDFTRLLIARALSKELASHNITVNTVVPGSIETVRGFAAGGNHGGHSMIGRRMANEDVEHEPLSSYG